MMKRIGLFVGAFLSITSLSADVLFSRKNPNIEINDVIVTTNPASIDFSSSFTVSDSSREANIGIDFSSIASRSDVILNQSTLESGARFHISSGTFDNEITIGAEKIVPTAGNGATIGTAITYGGARNLFVGNYTWAGQNYSGVGINTSTMTAMLDMHGNDQLGGRFIHLFNNGGVTSTNIDYGHRDMDPYLRMETSNSFAANYSGVSWTMYLRPDSLNREMFQVRETTTTGTEIRLYEAQTFPDYIAFKSSASFSYDQTYILFDSTGSTDQVAAIRGENSDGSRSLYWKNDNSGYNLEPATVTIRANQGITQSTGTYTSLSPGVMHIVSGSSNVITSLVSLSTEITGSLSVSNINATGTPSTSTILRGDGTWATAFSDYYEYIAFGSPDRVQATNVVFETDTASHTAYGKAEFSHSVSSQTNCAEFDGDMIRSYDSADDLRLENFSVWRGTGTDANNQRFVISVSSLTLGDVQTSISFGNGINVDLSDDSSGDPYSILAETGGITLTGWKDEIVAGAPYVIQVCRDGDAAQDSSVINSWLRRFTIRVGKTFP